ncbi:major facilitator superfamily transporter [Marasmius fiardii PR-910]|nr:major facilitator superfamily transporter [Marasmius fiardii PR-910]
MDRDGRPRDQVLNEETPLMPRKRQRTPLDWSQLTVLYLMQICEPIASQSIYPYINQLVSELDITGGDESKVGYYAGLIESLFFVTEALTVLYWSRTSDYIGRKPVLLIGLAGSTMSMLCFGLSRTFWALVVSRCLTGLLNGNIGVMKSTMGDVTDNTNRAEGFALLPVVWSFGATVGPLLGGYFARPQDRFPNVFKGRFWRDFPYFLPCLVASSYILTVFLISLVFLKESAPRRRRIASTDSNDTSLTEEVSKDEPLPLRQLLVYPVMISVSNYVALAFLNIAFCALLPLFFAMPISIGGLGLSPVVIGYILGGYGAATGIFQFFYFAKILRWLGERRMFLNSVSTFIVIFPLMPLCNVFARESGKVDVVCCVVIGIIIVLAVIMDMAFGAIFMFITSSAPNKSSLGATNGLSQTLVSVSRAVGPAMTTSLFSFSVRKNILGGYAVYALFCGLSVAAVLLGTKLPMRVWDDHDENED